MIRGQAAWLAGAIGCCVVAAPAQANTLMNWRYDQVAQRLEFSTAQPTQPQVQVLAEPPRLVVDLPGTVLGRPPERRDIVPLAGRESPVRQVRLGQLDPQTARLVLEFYPEYALTADAVQVQAVGRNRWVVSLSRLVARPASDEALTTVLEGVQVTDGGLTLRLQGPTPTTRVQRSPDRREIWVDIGAALAPQLSTETLNLAALGVLRFQAQQVQSQPPLTRLTLQVDEHSADWLVMPRGQGLVLVPQKPRYGPEAVTISSVQRLRPVLPSLMPVIDSVEWDRTNNQVLLRANRPFRYSQRWEREPGLNYASLRMVLESVRLSPRAEQALSSIPGLEVVIETGPGHQVTLIWRPSQQMRLIGIQELAPQVLAVQLLPGEANTPPMSALARWLSRRATPAMPRPTPPRIAVPRPTSGRPVVVLDPGHGGPDPGAIGIGGLREKDLVLDISQQVARLLERQGVQVVMTRTADVDLGLEPRVALARQVNATLFVSIHANAISLSRPDVNGIETYYFHPASYALAVELHRAMLQASGLADRGVRQARFYVIRNTPPTMPSVLLEVGFVTGAVDARFLASPEGRRAMAQGIAQGLLRYLRVLR
ncbi:MAG: N-acetylmuramoyl-L-alanine amidase [Gloeomargarita sp. SKYBB_i_bin120]|nr:N-acetylmuramoyl-L-alanine amidase [Gloeomargarita sp. SKYG98]MCS7293139.1 N-acetylmuramoyl-L-alanine amidase [Gloeomargarita sp. SKYB120]MDW8178704.1 N-acetylmuramoyl-L-alanine amidase [Gloeomargarita sp. SKYBB_i_bin120]